MSDKSVAQRAVIRICLYEFNMVHRFLQNQVYFDIEGDKIILAVVFCLVMFSFKIFLKKVQETECTSQYVESVFTKENCGGKQAMEFCSKVAATKLFFKLQTPDDRYFNLLQNYRPD